MDAGGKYRRDMGAVGVAFLIVNGLIGAGIFGLPEMLHQAVGGFAPWLMLIGGVTVMSIVVCFSDLTRLTDRSGGPQRFVGDAWGTYPGFLIGWTFFAARVGRDSTRGCSRPWGSSRCSAALPISISSV